MTRSLSLVQKSTLAILLLLGGLVGDVWSTEYVLSNSDSAVEGNPAALWLIERGLLLTAKLSVFLLVAGTIMVGLFLGKDLARAVNWILAVAVIHLVIVAWNLQGVII